MDCLEYHKAWSALSVENRKQRTQSLLRRHPDKVPTMLYSRSADSMRALKKWRFVVGREMTVGHFLYVVRRYNSGILDPAAALCLCANNTVLMPNKTLGEVYGEHIDEDGMLYLTYLEENAFG